MQSVKVLIALQTPGTPCTLIEVTNNCVEFLWVGSGWGSIPSRTKFSNFLSASALVTFQLWRWQGPMFS